MTELMLMCIGAIFGGIGTSMILYIVKGSIGFTVGTKVDLKTLETDVQENCKKLNEIEDTTLTKEEFRTIIQDLKETVTVRTDSIEERLQTNRELTLYLYKTENGSDEKLKELANIMEDV